MKILYFGEDNTGGGAKANLNLAFSAAKFAEVGFLGSDKSYPKSDNINVFDIKATQSISIKYILDFWNSLNTFDPDIVHATGMYTGFVALFIRQLRCRKYKLIMTLHHTSTRFRFNFIAKRLIPILNKIDVVHYLTEYQRNIYLGFGLNPNNFKVISNVLFSQSYPKEEVNDLRSKLLVDTSADWLIVYVGRLIESKQIHVFINAIKIINQLGHNTGGIIVGSGEKSYTEKLKKVCSELNINSKIIFTGFSLQPELYIKACDFCLFPTIHAEALPIFILESFSLYKTMVVSNHPSISSIVEDHVDSIIAYKHTSEEYAEKCVELMNHPKLLKKLEMEAGVKFNEYYKAEKVVEEFKEMYLKTINDQA